MANDFLTFAASATTNILNQADYASSVARATGIVAGLADEKLANKSWRQSAIISAVVAQLVCDVLVTNAVDDGTTATLLADLKQAVGQLGGASGFGAISGSTHTYDTTTNGLMVRRSNSGTAMFDTLPGTSPGILPLLSRVIVHNSDTTAILALTAGSGATLDGIAGNIIYLGPHQSADVRSDGTNYFTSDKPVRCILGANANLYVNLSTGSDSGNSGIATTSPFATIQHAYDVVSRNFDLAGYQVTINAVSTGAYAPFTCSGNPPGVSSPSSITIVGNTGTPANCTITATGASCVNLLSGAKVYIRGFKLAATGSAFGQGCGIFASDAGTYFYVDSCDFGSCTVADIQSFGGVKAGVGSYTVSGSSASHWDFNSNAELAPISTPNINFTGTPAFSTAVAYINNCSVVNLAGISFTGAVTGVSYSVNGNAVIASSGVTIPGSAGSSSSGGQHT